jgi:hypothetical protein
MIDKLTPGSYENYIIVEEPCYILRGKKLWNLFKKEIER